MKLGLWQRFSLGYNQAMADPVVDTRIGVLKNMFLDQIKEWTIRVKDEGPFIADDPKLQEILLHGYETLMSFAKHLSALQKMEEHLKADEKKYDAFVPEEVPYRIKFMQSMAVVPFLADLVDHLAHNYNENDI